MLSSSPRKRHAINPSLRRRVAVAAVSSGLVALCSASVAAAAPQVPAASGNAPHAPAAFSSAVAPAQPLAAAAPSVRGVPNAAAPIAADLSARPKPAPGGSAQELARQVVPANQYASFSAVVSHESGWNVHATNPSSGAYGLGQALPGGKMAAAGPNWRDDPMTQIRWTYNYMNSRYGSPNAAWSFWQGHHWY